mmetsp:Transcript_7990/g.26532  ORF Transcript_7990/g.26532 Transcript_7990/m.26532 type:complete len:209 (-) Transcript_7990:993-1619(-)
MDSCHAVVISSGVNVPAARLLWIFSSNASNPHCRTTLLMMSSILPISIAKRSSSLGDFSSKSRNTIISPKIDAVSASVSGGWNCRMPCLYDNMKCAPCPDSCASVATSLCVPVKFSSWNGPTPNALLQYAPPRFPFCAGTSILFSSTICVNSPAMVGENFWYPFLTISTASGQVYVSVDVPISIDAFRSDHVKDSSPWVDFKMPFFNK